MAHWKVIIRKWFQVIHHTFDVIFVITSKKVMMRPIVNYSKTSSLLL